METNRQESRLKPSLVEQSHNAHQAMLRAKERGDMEEVKRLNKFLDWCADQIREGKE